MMLPRLHDLLLKLLKVPDPPAAPDDSDPGDLVVFRASRRYYHLQLVKWGLGQAGALIGLAMVLGFTFFGVEFGLAFLDDLEELGRAGAVLVNAIEWIGIAAYFAQLPFTYMLVALDFEQRWYYLSRSSIRIREGVRSIREMTFTYDNIQEMSIQQGPLQRWLGIADLRVRTAGGGSGGTDSQGQKTGDASASFHIGYFRGIDDPGAIRERIRARMRAAREHDTEPVAPPPPDAGTTGSARAARQLVEEARLLRQLLEQRAG